MTFVQRLSSLPDATFPSSLSQVLVDRYSCSEVRLIGFEGWLYTCIRIFWHIDSAVMSVHVVTS